MRDEILCDLCPKCGSVPSFAWAEITPWFCPMEDCDVLGWDPYVSAYQNLVNAEYVEVIDRPRPPANGS